jgi:hypothetical protein
MARQLAITRKFSLSGVADGWTDESFVIYSPVAYGDLKTLRDAAPEGMQETDAIDFTLNFIKSHVISGKIQILDETGNPVVADFEKDDLDQLPPDTINAMFSALTGVKLDPKGTSTATETSPTLPPTPELQTSTTPTATS